MLQRACSGGADAAQLPHFLPQRHPDAGRPCVRGMPAAWPWLCCAAQLLPRQPCPSLVCAGIYAFHRLLGTYRKVNLITLTEFDRSKLLEFNRKASRPVFTPERLYCKPNGVATPNHSPLPGHSAKPDCFCWAAGRIKGAAHRHRGLAAAGAGRTAADRGRYRPAGSLGQRERPRCCNLYWPAPAWNTYRAFDPEPRRPLPQPVL